MKKFLYLILLAVFLSGLFTFVQVKAADYRADTMNQLSATAGANGANYGTARDPRAIVAQVIKIFLGTVGILFVAYTVYAGFIILTSGGNEEKVGKAKKMIFYATIGIIITLSAYGIVLFVQRYFVGDTGGLNGSASYGPWYVEGSLNVDESNSQFYSPDPLEQDTLIYH
ncbi:MAG: hypothetical protein US42_C0008G0069 [Candidatus Magasanikbacteria bacterium GW2011_GWC2_37_14]|uniref:Uncharacterized protein n=1 Tax=Candidatus Magasanikbacteria bacterium GW2011_GWC2_37_14 TaxID=1619046 RepID=A0A0G0G8Y2_9BACT|nr:MAG: hypothetical protein US42_C0008G0069 [Candidatus Magasanikbacteria bacterium GW2011_GWC2_37_14]